MKYLPTIAIVLFLFCFGTCDALAKPVAPAAFCKVYPDSKTCEGGPPPCTLCHSIAPARNTFGTQLSEHLAPGKPRPVTDEAFLAALPAALKAIEQADADGDGVNNLAEIMAGALPGDANSVPIEATCSAAEKVAAAKERWNVCGFDTVYVYRKVHMDFCGVSPSRAEMAAFAKISHDRKRWEPELASALDQCLASRYWLGKDGVVWNLANPKIKPIDSVKAGANAGPVPLADYEYDYNLFVWANSGDRDVRDLLLAQYFVKRVSDDPPKLQVMTEEELAALKMPNGQNVIKEKRVGMLTTRWFLTANTMFTAIPRTAAAQAFRAYLGYDIAHMEGLHPVEGQPAEFDRKGVTAQTCAFCHSTLDPMTYPFTRYNGIYMTNFAPTRLDNFVKVDGADIVKTPEKGVILGHEVKDLLELANVAAQSEDFARKVTRDYWKLLIGREPQPQDQREYGAMWRGLMDPKVYNYRVGAMLHGLVLTEAYGRP